jgi:hypothetical protein
MTLLLCVEQKRSLSKCHYDTIKTILLERLDVITEGLAEVMLTAHDVRGVDYKEDRFADREHFMKHMSGHAHTHLTWAVSAASTVLEATYSTDHSTEKTPAELGVRLCSQLVTALKDPSLRDHIRKYNQAAASRTADRVSLHKEIVTKWKNIFLANNDDPELSGINRDQLFDLLLTSP